MKKLDTALFDWSLSGQAVVVDNGGRFLSHHEADDILALDGLEMVLLDPSSRFSEEETRPASPNLQYFPHVGLGTGQPATLYACLNSDWSATLMPLADDELGARQQQDAQVLAEIPIQTLALDQIDGLSRVDWLILDSASDNLAILQSGEKILADTQLMQIRIPFSQSHRGQSGFESINRWAAEHGFLFYRFIENSYGSYLPGNAELEKKQATQLTATDALFVPDAARRKQLPPAECEKLAFILDTVYGIHDLSYEVLAQHDEARARNYLLSRGYLSQYNDEPDTFTLIAAYSPAPWAA